MPVRNVIVDTDGGIDDCIALLALLRDPNINIVALTAVFGNATLENVKRNLGLLLSKFNKGEKIPIYAGASRGLIESNPEPWEGHGPNGLGGADFDVEPQLAEEEHACFALCQLSKKYEGNVDLITLGPLTNIALACRLDADFLSRMRSVWVMGGSHLGRGNATRSAEFNFCCDPEAAHIALASSDKITIVTWELAEHYRLQWDRHMDVLYALGTDAADWLKQTFAHYDSMSRNQKDPAPEVAERVFFEHTDNMDAGVTICDLYLVFAYLHFDTAVQRTFARRVDVELGGRFARGSLQIDWYSEQSKTAPNARIVTCIDVEHFFDFLRGVIAQQ